MRTEIFNPTLAKIRLQTYTCRYLISVEIDGLFFTGVILEVR